MRTNEQNLDLFADLLEPVGEILTDPDVVEAVQGGSPIKAVKPAIKNHKRAIVEILAALEGIDPDEYIVPPPAALMAKVIQLVNDPMVQEVFTMQGQMTAAASSGSAMENIEDGVS